MPTLTLLGANLPSAGLVATDPMLDTNDWWSSVLLFVATKVLVIFVIGLVGTMFMIWFERKVVSYMHNRIGPNKAGPRGLLQSLADGTKLFFKEDLLPTNADKWVFRLAPFAAFVPAFLLWSVIPLGGNFRGDADGTVKWGSTVTRVQLMDPPVGILIVLALSAIGVYGILLAGWSSGSKYPLLGSIRASAQMISYEAALGMSLAAVLLMSGSLQTSTIVDRQDGFTNWNLVATGFVPFVIFLIAMTAELNRPPFDLVEAEQELVGGFNTEYSSIRFALFFLAEFMNVMTMSAIIVTLFLGGPQPLLIGEFNLFGWAGWFGGTIWVLIKTLTFMYFYVWLRATLPRLRYDQLMDLGWKILIPMSLVWFLLLTAIQLRSQLHWNFVLTFAIGLAAVLVAYGLFAAALSVAKRNRDDERAVF